MRTTILTYHSLLTSHFTEIPTLAVIAFIGAGHCVTLLFGDNDDDDDDDVNW